MRLASFPPPSPLPGRVDRPADQRRRVCTLHRPELLQARETRRAGASRRRGEVRARNDLRVVYTHAPSGVESTASPTIIRARSKPESLDSGSRMLTLYTRCPSVKAGPCRGRIRHPFLRPDAHLSIGPRRPCCRGRHRGPAASQPPPRCSPPPAAGPSKQNFYRILDPREKFGYPGAVPTVVEVRISWGRHSAGTLRPHQTPAGARVGGSCV